MSTVIEQLGASGASSRSIDGRPGGSEPCATQADRAADLGQLELYVRRAAPRRPTGSSLRWWDPPRAAASSRPGCCSSFSCRAYVVWHGSGGCSGTETRRAAAAVAAVWQRICTYRLDRRPIKVAANILMDAAKELRRAATTKGGPTQELPAIWPTPDPQQPAADELVQILDDAVHDGALTIADAQLVAAFRITGQRLADIAGHRGTSVRTVRRRRAPRRGPRLDRRRRMSQTSEFQVVPAPIRSNADSGRHGPDHYYVENVWLPVIGPAAYVVWRHLARLASRSPRRTISLPPAAAVTGLGPPGGHQSSINRALRRLERFDLIHLDADRIVVRVWLPFITKRQLARLDPAIQALHRRYRDRCRTHSG